RAIEKRGSSRGARFGGVPRRRPSFRPRGIHLISGDLAVMIAIVGFSLAALYSAIYWVLARYVMRPMLAVAIAFLVAVSIGFVLHSRWSFRGHGAREDHRLKVKFLLVQASGGLLNEVFTWVLT